mmetsp:Transcript_8533/g.23824  ORF Transcript_8533/g.23824 Transcript_8533/m.23824 type:complete len:325 (+) Transcript_8533:68-1042(+)
MCPSTRATARDSPSRAASRRRCSSATASRSSRLPIAPPNPRARPRRGISTTRDGAPTDRPRRPPCPRQPPPCPRVNPAGWRTTASSCSGADTLKISRRPCARGCRAFASASSPTTSRTAPWTSANRGRSTAASCRVPCYTACPATTPTGSPCPSPTSRWANPSPSTRERTTSSAAMNSHEDGSPRRASTQGPSSRSRTNGTRCRPKASSSPRPASSPPRPTPRPGCRRRRASPSHSPTASRTNRHSPAVRIHPRVYPRAPRRRVPSRGLKKPPGASSCGTTGTSSASSRLARCRMAATTRGSWVPRAPSSCTTTSPTTRWRCWR